MPDNTPFEQLSEADQKAAVDIGVAVSVLGTRLNCGKELYDFVATEFVRRYSIPANIAKYALREVGKSLFTNDWTFTAEKKAGGLTTSFQRSEDRDGDSPLQETTIIH